jgi:hypothetical protein
MVLNDHEYQQSRCRSADDGAARGTGGDRAGADHDRAYVLRLCLDLQLHALLLALGAAASTDSTAEAPGESGGDGPPWRRWIAQDVNLACSLTTKVLQGGAALPSTLGSDLHRSVPATTMDTLAELYQSMITRLEILAQARPTEQEPVGEALESCRRRLAELKRHRLATTPPRRITLPQAERHFLAGELLG